MTNPTAAAAAAATATAAAAAADDDSPFNRLPDEIVLAILNKLIELKTLCRCKLVSTRFCSIVHQVDAISFTCDGGLPSTGVCFDFDSVFESLKKFTTLMSVCMELPSDFDSNFAPSSLAYSVMIACFESDSFFSAITSMNNFTAVKSLSIKLLLSKSKEEEEEEEEESTRVDYNRYLFKWKVKLSTYRLNSFCFLSPNSICCNTSTSTSTSNSNGNGHEEDDEEEDDIKMKKLNIAVKCLSNAIQRFNMLFSFTIYFPLMEKVSVTDSAQRGTVSVSGEKITELSNWLQSYSSYDTVEKRMRLTFERPRRVSWCYIPLLELPVSGYIMKGVTLVLIERDDLPDNGNDSFLNIDEHDVGFEDKEEDAAYSEAVIEIFKKHRGRIERLL